MQPTRTNHQPQGILAEAPGVKRLLAFDEANPPRAIVDLRIAVQLAIAELGDLDEQLADSPVDCSELALVAMNVRESVTEIENDADWLVM
jgi:hypothetical protein